MKKKKLINEKCRETASAKGAVFFEKHSQAVNLRVRSRLWKKRIQTHITTNEVSPIGTCFEHGFKTIGGWNLLYDVNDSRWSGEGGDFFIDVHWNVDTNDLDKLLKTFAQAVKASIDFERQKKLHIRIGHQLGEDCLASVKANYGIIDWKTSRNGKIPAAIFDDGTDASPLCHMICRTLSLVMDSNTQGWNREHREREIIRIFTI